ncbi:MAG TPA: TonB-dependent receptor, partial [Nevskiaceae bacterium]|nr:TonB-dependent receptor [Nevskiaceae bacterium]
FALAAAAGARGQEAIPADAPAPPPDPAATQDAPQAGSRLLGEIVVTAQKREENLQDVPISVQAFSAEVLDAKGIRDAKDLPHATPGLTVTTQVSYTSIFLRGVGSDAWLLADPSVATYTDGIYFPFSNGLVQDFGAVERIEVLKGPQGTLFGRNAIAGAVNVITRAPSLSEPEVSAQTTFADYDTMQYRLHASIPLTSTLAFGVSGVYLDADNHIKGESNGEPLPAEQAKAARAKLRWMPADWLELNLTQQYLHQKGAGTNYLPTTKPSLLSRLAGVQPQDPYAGSVNEPTFYDHTDHTRYGQLDLRFDALDVKLLGSDQFVESHADIDFDGSDQPLARFDVLPIYADVQTGELQIVSNDTSWGADRLRWIVGGYWFRSDTGIDPGVLTVASTDLQSNRVLGIDIDDPLAAGLFDFINDLPLPLPSGPIAFIGTLQTNSKSVYAQATADFTDWAALTLGGRYQHEKRYIIESKAGTYNVDGTITPIVGTGGVQDFSGKDDPRFRDTTKGFDPKVSLDFHPGWSLLGDDALLYVSWQKATKSSTFNVVNIYDPPDKAKAEKIEAYEVGIKTRLFDGLVSLNAAAFHYTLDDPQVQVVSLLQGGAVAFENAGQAKTKGIDFDTVVSLFPSLTDGGLVLTLGGCWLDPEYTDYTGGTGFDPVTGIRTSNNDYTGNQVVRSAKFSGTAALSWTIQTGIGPVELASDYYWTDEYYYLAQNLDADKEDAYGVLGARISWLYEPWNLRLTAFGKNITNTGYSYSLFVVDFGTGDARAPLSTYGLRINWDF